ncbi:cellulose biosynthesis protein BcsQ [Vibrio aphrogenes]|uniref:cellulose biosynthesis protein BcsQ n=1 Tax=Vibrio aphrogenes TaxID=1891186 RepID=UPI000B35A1AE|nr:cellulose biosynthesis protein BcsQ [Vibrio aphrogenes]
MKRIVITGIRGGVGATTVAANLVTALHSIDQQTHIIDLNRENMMRFHFGMEPKSTDGWAVRWLTGESWMQAGYQTHRHIAFVPFGQLSANQYQHMHQAAQAHPEQFIECFDVKGHKPAQDNQWQILLLPCLPSLEEMHFSLIERADLVVCVVRPDIQSYSLLEQSPCFQKLTQVAQPKLLLNQCQPSSEINRDLQLVMQYEFEAQLIPVLMHTDTAVSEAIANLQSVLESSPYSQAAQDYHALAFWCLSYLNQNRSLETPHV